MTWLGRKRVFELAKVITSTPIKNIFIGSINFGAKLLYKVKMLTVNSVFLS